MQCTRAAYPFYSGCAWNSGESNQLLCLILNAYGVQPLVPMVVDLLSVETRLYQARANLMQAAAVKLDPIATEALAILEKKLMEDVSRDAEEVGNF